MFSILESIIEHKRGHIERQREILSSAQIIDAAKSAPPVRGFAKALKESLDQEIYGLIAEIKKASPSKGVIREDFDPPALASQYATGGATCLSILTDRPYFQGSDQFLRQARDACNLPVLRKDFIIDEYQIAESRALGSDCILLIMAILNDREIFELANAAYSLDMDVLFEVHNAKELLRTIPLKPKLIGINNRNLSNFDVDLSVTEVLAPLAPRDAIIISESGLTSAGQLARMSAAGVNCFLIGESLMRAKDVARATKDLIDPKLITTRSNA